jgi:glycosyltransferase involved in cell wall biosynthesis
VGGALGGGRLLIVSGNRFPLDDWTHSTALIWFGLAAYFDEIHVFARAPGNVMTTAHNQRVHLHLVPSLGKTMRSSLASSWLLPRVAHHIDPTHILAQSPVFGGPAAVTWGLRNHVPSLVEVHGEYYFEQGPLIGGTQFRQLIKPVTKYTFARARAIRVLSEGMAQQVLNVYGPEAGGKCVVVPPRVDTRLFKGKQSHNQEITSAICVGSLIPIKGHANLVRSLAEVAPEVRLTIAGEGPERGNLERLARSLGLNLSLPGYLPHPQLAEELIRSDVYIHPSTTEAVPRAVLEAMASGLPVVSSNAGYLIADLLRAKAGVVFDPKTSASLSSALEQLRSRTTREQMGFRAREQALTRYEWRTQMEAYARLIYAA